MPKITSIDFTAGRRKTTRIRIDGEDWMSVGPESVARLKLEPGQEVDPEALRRTLTEAEESRAREACLKKLAVRSRSAQELARHLEQTGFDPEVIRRVLERLQSVRLVDDAAFSQAYVRDRLRSGGRSRRALQAELQQRGVERDVAEETANLELPDETGTCLALAQRKARQYQGLDRSTARRRLAAFLARRGFAAEDVFKAVDQVMPEQE